MPGGVARVQPDRVGPVCRRDVGELATDPRQGVGPTELGEGHRALRPQHRRAQAARSVVHLVEARSFATGVAPRHRVRRVGPERDDPVALDGGDQAAVGFADPADGAPIGARHLAAPVRSGVASERPPSATTSRRPGHPRPRRNRRRRRRSHHHPGAGRRRRRRCRWRRGLPAGRWPGSGSCRTRHRRRPDRSRAGRRWGR